MKRIILLIFAITFSVTVFAQTVKPCPVEGTAKTDKDKIANRYKNRDIENADEIDTTITLIKMLAPGEDSKRFNPDSFVKITGYIVEVKPGGIESCNCLSTDDQLQDKHIYVGLTPNAAKSNCIIVEVTPKWKKLNPNFNFKLFIGKKVNIYGYIFFDAEHKGNARNTCDHCANIWRATCNEIHPVTEIELIK